MLKQGVHIGFVIEMAIALALGFVTWFVSWKNHSAGKERKLRVNYFTTPANNIVMILGALVPILVGLLSFFYLKEPKGSYSSLLASIVLLFVVLVIAAWLPFALLKKATNQDEITLNFPEDRKFITSMGLMSIFTLVGFLYFALFFLFELPIPNVGNESTILLRRSKPKVGQSRAEIEGCLGQPDSTNSIIEYKTQDSTMQLVFDAQGKLQNIKEIKEKE